MALITHRERTPRTFLRYNATSGELVLPSTGPSGEKIVTALEGVTGVLQSVKYKADPGNPKANVEPGHKLEILLREDGQDFQITLNATTFQANEIMGRLNGADLGHPMFIGPWHLPKGSPRLDGQGETTNDMYGLTLRQGPGFKTKVEPFYGEGMVRPETVYVLDDSNKPVMRGGKPMVDEDACAKSRLNMSCHLVAEVLTRLNGGAETQTEGVDPAEAQSSAERPRQGG